jgi:S-adenosylmethionine decarboxylase
MRDGRHIKVVGNGPAGPMRDVDAIRSFLQETVAELGMRCLGSPHMYEVKEEVCRLGVEPFEDEGGVTGVVVLSTSHCAVHTWPLRMRFVMDVYSCRDFETATVERMVRKYFAPQQLRITDVSYTMELEPAWAAEPGDGALTVDPVPV